MDAREAEQRLLARLADLARGVGDSAEDEREANLIRLASLILGHDHVLASERLAHVSNAYFCDHPGSEVAAEQVIANGWLGSLPRLRTQLLRALETDRVE